MDVTNQNFLATLPEITKTIQECDFIAIDTELSGLMRERNNNRFDLPEERFAKAVESSRGYFIMQFGLSCFKRCDTSRYTNRTYNFYIFPQPTSGFGDIDRTFSLQAHAIQFLTEHNFDFNKLFKHGLSYLTFQEKKTISTRLKLDIKARSKVEINSNGLPKFVPNSMADSCKEWLKLVKKFVEDRNEATQVNDGSPRIDVNMLPDQLELHNCSTNHKRTITKRLLECQPFNDNIEITNKYDPDKNDTYVLVKYVTKTEKQETQKNALMNAKGFLEVLELMIVNKKPIVGHNLYLDLIQLINQFIEPLTDDYNSFKETCHSLFPLIYDTKFIAHLILDPETLTNNQSRLNDLYCQLRISENLPKIAIDHIGTTFDENQLPHQAGYDAYMSGYSFIVLCESYLKDKRKYKFKKEDPNIKSTPIAQEYQIVTDFSNKIHLSYSYDFKFFNLGGEEEIPDRSHIFYVEFPSTWVLEDIFQVFYSYGGVTVGYLSKTSALCALRDPKQASSVVTHSQKPKDNNYRILPYEFYLENIKPKKRNGGDEDVEFLAVS